METLTIDWYRVERGGDTCDRCRDTGAALRAAVADLQSGLADCGVRPSLTVHDLDPSLVAVSNAVFVDGVPVEELVEADVRYTDCPSCTGLLGESTDCRALDQGEGTGTDALSPGLVREAAFAAACGPDCCVAGGD